MDEPKALIRLEPLKPLNPCALPKYFTQALAARKRSRSEALSTAVAESMSASFFAFIAVLFGYITGHLWIVGGPLILLAIMTTFVSAVGVVVAIKDGWSFLERVGFLLGTREETKYLPANCRESAEAEASLAVAFDEVDAATFKWNEVLPQLEEAGSPRLYEIAIANRARLEARRSTIAVQTARLWVLAAQSTNPPALPAGVTMKTLKPADS